MTPLSHQVLSLTVIALMVELIEIWMLGTFNTRLGTNWVIIKS
jgi:hypothetical protein